MKTIGMIKATAILIGLITALTSLPVSAQKGTSINANIECTVDSASTYPGVPSTFFRKGAAFISGKINDYNRDLGFDNISLIYTSPLTGDRTVRTVDIADDGRFSAAIDMEIPGFVNVEGGNNWISARYYAEPSRTLHVEFDFKDMHKLMDDNPLRYYIGQRVSRFAGDTGEINRQISAAPLMKQCDVIVLAVDAVPRIASEEINAIYQENKKDMEEYIASSDIHPLAAVLLWNDLLGEYASSMALYDSKRCLNIMMKPDSPSLKENPDISFYDWWERLLTETDEWFLTSQYMEGTQSHFIRSYFPYLFDAETRYRYHIHYDPMAFLRSKGAILTQEEEEIAQWFALNVGKTLYLKSNESNIYHEKLPKAYSLAVRSGLESEYLEYVGEQNRKLKENGVAEDNCDVPYNVGLMAEAIKKFTGKDEVPFLWQAIQTYLLTGANELSADEYSKPQMDDILVRIKDSKAITHPVLLDALTEFYERAYTLSNFELPDDERGNVIKSIIEPYKGKVILLDFWATSCAPCRTQIEESADERHRNLNHPDFKRIFITGEADSPLEVYEEYVVKNLSDETSLRLSDTDYRKIMDIFGFTGLPQFVLIDRNGKVLDPDLDHQYLHRKLSDLGITLFQMP